jgi:cephalosporin hydroxylase
MNQTTGIEQTRDHDLGYLVTNLKGLYVKLAANEGWFRQTWMGVPIWQLPDDLVRLQRVVFDVKPTWIVETGTKFGGSAIFFASLLAAMGRTAKDPGGIVTVDIHQTTEAKEVLATHPLAGFVKKTIVGDAAAAETVAAIRQALGADPGGVLVILDDNHNADHVRREIAGYAPLVTLGSYLIVADTVFEELAGTPVGKPTDKYPDVAASNPRAAVTQFLAGTTTFHRDLRYTEPGVSNFPDGFLRRVSA